MAKKSIATLKKEDGRNFAKVIKAVKSKSGSYTFREEMVPVTMVKDVLSGNK